MKITKRQLRRIIREAEGSTKKYDDDSALKGGQSRLHDKLQKAIIDKTVEDREEREEEEREEKNESMKITKRQLKRIIKEEKDKIIESAYQPVSTAFQDIYDGMLDAFYQSVEALGTHDQEAVFRLKAEIQQRGLDFKGDALDYINEFDEGPSYRDPLDPGDTI